MPAVTPVDLDFVGEAKHVITTTVDVNASTSAVWAKLIDNPGWTEWFPQTKSCETTSEQQTGVGCTRRIHVQFLKVDERFIAWDEERRWAFTVTHSNLPVAKKLLEMVELEAVGTDDAPVTRLTYTGALEPHFLTALTVPLVKRQVRSAWKKGFVQLGELLA